MVWTTLKTASVCTATFLVASAVFAAADQAAPAPLEPAAAQEPVYPTGTTEAAPAHAQPVYGEAPLPAAEAVPVRGDEAIPVAPEPLQGAEAEPVGPIVIVDPCWAFGPCEFVVVDPCWAFDLCEEPVETHPATAPEGRPAETAPAHASEARAGTEPAAANETPAPATA